MSPWQLLDSTQAPAEDNDPRLCQRRGEFSIQVDGSELMNRRVHGSESFVAELAYAKIASIPCPHVLIGGLGMGRTLMIPETLFAYRFVQLVQRYEGQWLRAGFSQQARGLDNMPVPPSADWKETEGLGR